MKGDDGTTADSQYLNELSAMREHIKTLEATIDKLKKRIAKIEKGKSVPAVETCIDIKKCQTCGLCAF